MIIQTLALFRNAYRELNARKMFWIALILSGLLAASFGALGINSQGVTVFTWTLPAPGINTLNFTQAQFYKYLFLVLGINIWLSFGATILALISTAGLFPNFISSGSIDLVLSKPIGRLRLFFTKYATGLLFVTLQVALFTLASFLVIGVRGGVWEPGLFLAIPLVVIFFSYLFSVCVLLGVLTRSTITALLLTLLFWFFLFLLSIPSDFLVQGRVRTSMRIEALEQRIESAEPETRAQLREKLSAQRELLQTLQTFENISYWVRTFVPKTGETIDLLGRTLISLANLPESSDSRAPPQPQIPSEQEVSGDVTLDRSHVARRVAKATRSRSVAWILGTSLGFEAVMLALAAWVFRRRDY